MRPVPKCRFLVICSILIILLISADTAESKDKSKNRQTEETYSNEPQSFSSGHNDVDIETVSEPKTASVAKDNIVITWNELTDSRDQPFESIGSKSDNNDNNQFVSSKRKSGQTVKKTPDHSSDESDDDGSRISRISFENLEILFKPSVDANEVESKQTNKDKSKSKQFKHVKGDSSKDSVDEDTETSEAEVKLHVDSVTNVKYMAESILISIAKNAQERNTDFKELSGFEHLDPKNKKNDLEPEEGLSVAQLVEHEQFKKAVENSDYETLFRLADQGHSKSQDHVLNAYLFGKVAFKLDDLIKRVFDYSSKGNAMANMFKGFLYTTGLGVKTNHAKSLVYMMGAALSGNTYAQMALGYRYLTGVLVDIDCNTAIEYYQRVAENVVRSVELTGGMFIQRIRFLDEDENPSKVTMFSNEILQYYQYMAEKGDPGAHVVLGQLYLQGGRSVQQDTEKAMRYFKPAADEGNSNAMAYLGKIYFEIYHDYKNAYYYFSKAAEEDNAIGQCGLGLLYLYGKGVEMNYAKAFKYLNLSASKGWVESQFYIGLMYLKGYGVAKDYKNAIRYFMLSSQAGNVLAIYNLAMMHVSSKETFQICLTAAGLFKNVAERSKWSSLIMDAYNDYREGRVLESYFKYSFLAELGHEVAQTNAATILDRNELKHIYSKEENYARAFRYWQQAAEQGYSIARVKLGDYHFYGLGTRINLEQAAEEYRTAAHEKQCAQALFNLGYMYQQGLGLPRDLHLAKRYYDLAEKSSTDAQLPVALARLRLFWIHLFEDSNLQLSLDDFITNLLNDEWYIDLWDIISIGLLVIFGFIIFLYRQLVA